MKILFVGDVHGDFDSLHVAISASNADIAIQCGDFGIWPTMDMSGKDLQFNIPVYFCRGNHEWHTFLNTNYSDTEIEPLNKGDLFPKARNIYHCPNGSILKTDDCNILFYGGGLSVDKHERREGFTWWPEEQMSDEKYYEVLERVKNANCGIDIVVSHTCPQYIVDQQYKELSCSFYDFHKIHDNTQTQLAHLKEHGAPNAKLWVFGHWHTDTAFTDNGTVYIGRNMSWQPGFTTVVPVEYDVNEDMVNIYLDQDVVRYIKSVKFKSYKLGDKNDN